MHYYFKNTVVYQALLLSTQIHSGRSFLASEKKSSFFAFFFSYYVYAFDPFEWNMCLKVSWILHRVSNTKRVLSCNCPFLLAKNRPFLCTSIGVGVHFTMKDRVQKVILYICTIPAPSLSKEMEPETRIYWNILCRSISICTATITKCNQKRYYYMSNPFLN